MASPAIYPEAMAVPFHTPVAIVPTLVRLDPTTALPKAVAVNVEALLILNTLPLAIFQSWLDVKFEFVLSQIIVLSVAPFNVIPPPLAVVSDGVSTLPISMFLSSTVNVVELIVDVVPFTVKSPDNVRFTPVAVPVNAGDTDNTVLPVPVEVVTPVPPLATDKVPVVPATIGRPVMLVATPLAGVPNAGVTNVGDVRVPVAFVNTSADGVPSAGVVKVGEVKVLLVKVWVPVKFAS